MKFTEFGLVRQVMEGIEAIGFTEATPIQSEAIPLIMQGSDIMGCAQTGTGKTAAFLLPVLHHIVQGDHKGIKALVIAPTRELALQIDQQLQGLSYFAGISSLAVYGGTGGFEYELEKKALREGAEMVIATPGRLLSHLAMGNGDLSRLDFLILDEADRMLDMGFHDDIMRILSFLPDKRQTLLFSATMPPKIRTLANKILHRPAEVNIAVSKPAEGILQAAYLVHDEYKIDLLRTLIEGKNLSSVLIFASTKTSVKAVESDLKKHKIDVASMHSDHDQSRRTEIMRLFYNKQVPVVVATDILSRGIDVEAIDLVVNYNVPRDPEDYVHRIGRTARASKSGVAITFVNGEELQYLRRIEAFLGAEVRKIGLPDNMSGPSPDSRKHTSGGSRGYKGRKPTGKKHHGSGSRKGKARPGRKS